MPTQITKRSGDVVPFNKDKIVAALERCFKSVNPEELHDVIASQVEFVTDKVINLLQVKEGEITVEIVQDCVILVLQSNGHYSEAEHYIIYRHEHAKKREANYIPPDVMEAYARDDAYFETPLQRFQFWDKYSRWDDGLVRRETWVETVDRATNFMSELIVDQLEKKYGRDIPDDVLQKFDMALENAKKFIRQMKVMPSMRLMAMAGPAAKRDNSVIYNCAYLAIDGIDAFCELMLNSMAGCGVGYSVEFENVDKLPKVKLQTGYNAIQFDIEDSAEGWARALRMGLTVWFTGGDVEFNYSYIRPEGTPLKTKGGRASGPRPLRELLLFIRERMLARQGKKLTTLDVHDICCAIGNAVVSGGVRRTALISIFDQDDELMLHCKDGDFAKENSQRWNANNSAVWAGDITQKEFVDRLMVTFNSERGEPGIFSREAAIFTMPDRRRNKGYGDYGVNPCGEINLRSKQFCNLTDVVARQNDTYDDLIEKVQVAAFLGTVQSLATYFPNLRREWQYNCEEERLLGIGISGQLDCLEIQSNATHAFIMLKQEAVNTNKYWAEELGINQSTAVSCVKPSGNSSTLVNSSPGMHARWSPYYIRRVRVSASSPVARVLKEAGVPISAENGQDPLNPVTLVASFPVKSPNNAITIRNWSALDQCNWWLKNKLCWTEHNPSVTITYKENEVLDIINWLWENKEYVNGVSFLPESNAKYDQLPYEEITEEQYRELVEEFPRDIPWHKLYLYEKSDFTQASTISGCDTDICELPVL